MQRVPFRYQHHIVAPRISSPLVFGQLWLLRRECAEQAILLDEGEQSDALPGHLFPVHVDVKVARVKVEDRRVFLGHEQLEWLGQVLFTVSEKMSQLRDRECVSQSTRLAAGKTPINCSNGLNG